jgi:hypothetical protein
MCQIRSIQQTLANSWVTPETPQRVGKGGEIVEVIRTEERLCRWCGGEHLGACSEEECNGNPRKGKYRQFCGVDLRIRGSLAARSEIQPLCGVEGPARLRAAMA